MDRVKDPILVSISHGENVTVVCFKGCSLQCPWCLHPEAISPDLEIKCNSDNCIACGECVHGCPQKAITLNKDILYRDRNNCDLCLNCVEICPSLVFSTVGERYSCKEVTEQIKTHLVHQSRITGDIHFTGGEPLLQPDALIRILDECGTLPVRRIVYTSGSVPTSILLEVAKRTDLFLYTIMHMNSAVHRQITGQPNELILHNLRELSAIGADVQIQLFLTKEVNDDEDNIKATGAFLTQLKNINAVQLLFPWDLQQQAACHETEASLRTQYHAPEEKTVVRVKTILAEYGLHATAKGKGPFYTCRTSPHRPDIGPGNR